MKTIIKNKYSKNLNVQLIAELLVGLGIEHIVLSPGSRNGSLATHFSYHPKLKTYSIVDERSAGFVAVGMAQKLKKPVVVCCTSGSATVNYYPAVTEAFYQNIPLIVLSADRPEILIDNFDGQTIRQKDVFLNHSYHNTQLTEDDSTQGLTDNLGLIKKALTACIENNGPVHINMPFSEPLYEFQDSIGINLIHLVKPVMKEPEIDFTRLLKDWNQAEKKLILVGVHSPNEDLNRLISQLADDDSVVILTETTSNLHNAKFINRIDHVIFSLSDEELKNLQPDLLLTIGQNVVSKKVKAFLRKFPAQKHWHIDQYWQPDTYHQLTDRIQANAVQFLSEFINLVNPKESGYFNKWNEIKEINDAKFIEFINQTGYSDFMVFNELVPNIPNDWVIHYSNSSAVRYAQMINHHPSNPVYCNRGTSGIDGSSSTSAGFAMVSEQPVLLVTGDIGFFYDSNALWNNYIPSTYRIIMINNGGGNIFKIIPGPDDTGLVESVFETRHQLSAEYLAKMFGFEYERVHNLQDFKLSLSSFFAQSDRPKILEVNTANIEDNAETLRKYFRFLKKD